MRQVAEGAVGQQLANDVDDLEFARGQGERAPDAGGLGGVNRRSQPVGAVRPGLIEQRGHAGVDAGVQVAGREGVAAGDQRHVGLHGLQALGGGVEDRAAEGLGHRGAFGFQRVERADKLVPKLDGRAAHAEPVMTVGEDDGAHGAGSGEQISA